MPRKILPSMFNRRATFGIIKSIQNSNSIGYKQHFVANFSLWVYPQKRTLNQQYQVYKTELQDSIVLVIRHNSKVNDQLKIKYDNKLYQILHISSDDSFNYMTYDYLTCKEIKKAGGFNG